MKVGESVTVSCTVCATYLANCSPVHMYSIVPSDISVHVVFSRSKNGSLVVYL